MNGSPRCNTGNGLTTGLPAKYFTGADAFRRARERIFFRTWQYACHASEVREAGDFVCFSICEQDVFVIRTREQGGEGADNGRLRAFYNVCRHRGHKLLKGAGKRQTIVCPYHAWSYDLNGHLRAAPNAERVPGFAEARDNIRLSEVAVEEFLGFVFVNLAEAAEVKPMDECYPNVRAEILTLCPDIEQRAFAHGHAAREECNWLVAVENYNECYHCPVAHAAFSEGVVDPDTYNIVPFGDGRCLRHSARAAGGEHAWYRMADAAYGSFYLWPATAVQIYPGGVVNSYHWRPLAPDGTEVHRRWYSPDGAVDAQLQEIIDLDRETTFAEDLRLVKNVQRGLGSRGFVPGPLMIDPGGGISNELSIAALHRWLRESLD